MHGWERAYLTEIWSALPDMVYYFFGYEKKVDEKECIEVGGMIRSRRSDEAGLLGEGKVGSLAGGEKGEIHRNDGGIT